MKDNPSTGSTGRALSFAAIAIAVYAAALAVIRFIPRADKPNLLTGAVTLDLVVFIPVTYYLLLVRSRRAPPISVVAVVMLSFAAASMVLPAEHRGLFEILAGVLPLGELALTAWVVHRIWRWSRTRDRSEPLDVYDRIRQLLNEVLGVPWIGGMVAYELALAYYAFRLPHTPASTPDTFTHHRKSGYGMVLGVFLMAAFGELFGVHFLLRRWSTTAALFHAILSLYAVIWLVGDFRALRARPHRVTATGLEVRTGLRWSMDVPREQVASIRRAWGPRPDERDGYRALVPLASIDFLITFKTKIDAFGPYGSRKTLQRIGIQVDEIDRFEERLRGLGCTVVGL